MAKTLEEILAENDALNSQAQLREYLQKLTGDQTRLQGMSTTELRKEYEQTFKILQKIENKQGVQKGDILRQDSDLSASAKKLKNAIEESSNRLDILNDGVFSSLKGFEGFAQAAGGAAFAAAAGFKGLNLVLQKAAAGYDTFKKPFLESTADIIGEFGAATDKAGNFTDTLGGGFARAEADLMNLVGSAARGTNATGTAMAFFSADLTESFKQVREGLSSLRKSFKDNLFILEGELKEAVTGKQLIQLQNILGATGEDMSALGSRAQIMGSTVSAQAAVARQSAEDMAEAFGLRKGAGKVIATAVNALRRDFRNFGTFTEDQLAKVTAQSMKLGISLEGIKKLNMFDDFDKAAESAAMLGQSFGLNIDAFDLFMEEDPTERLRMIQEAASQAGLDIANMSRVEMNYLADLTGMGVEDTMKALSEGGLELQSQLGEAPDVAKTAQEQTAQLIKAQGDIQGAINKFSSDLKPFIDSAATVAKNIAETTIFKAGGPKKIGDAIGQSFTAITGKALEKAMSAGAQAFTMRIQKSLLGAVDPDTGRQTGGALQNLTKQAEGLIGAAGGAIDSAGQALNKGQDVKGIGKAALEGAKEGLPDFIEGSQGIGKQLQGLVTGGGKGSTSLESEFKGLAGITSPGVELHPSDRKRLEMAMYGKELSEQERKQATSEMQKMQPLLDALSKSPLADVELDALELFKDDFTAPTAQLTKTLEKLLSPLKQSTSPSAEKPATPEVSSTSASPTTARDRTVTAEAKRDADGNVSAESTDTQLNQTIKVILNVDGKLLADTVLAQQMTNDSLAGSTVGGNLRNAARAQPS